MNIEQEKMIVEALPSLYPLQEFEKKAIHKVIDALPSVEPEKRTEERAETHDVCLDTISRQASIEAVQNRHMMLSKEKTLLINDLEKLPSVEPKRIRGKWIYHIDDLFPVESTMECNQCHAEQPLICDDEFCPKCGAKMERTE